MIIQYVGLFCIQIFVFIVIPFLQIHFSKKIAMYLTCTHTHSCRSTSTLDPIANDSTIVDYDFECTINQAEDESEEDCDIPGELARLLLSEEKSI